MYCEVCRALHVEGDCPLPLQISLPGIAYYMETEEVLVSAIWDGEFPWYGGEKLKLLCKEHYFFSTISDAHCHLCSQISRANTYKSMKDGSYIYRPAVGENSSTRATS